MKFSSWRTRGLKVLFYPFYCVWQILLFNRVWNCSCKGINNRGPFKGLFDDMSGLSTNPSIVGHGQGRSSDKISARAKISVTSTDSSDFRISGGAEFEKSCIEH